MSGPRIDAHIHWNADHPDAAALLEELDLRLINVSVATDNHGQWRKRSAPWRKLAGRDPQRFAWVTSFDLPRFEDRDYADRVIAELSTDLAAGAVACKVWKNVGMEVRGPDGSWLMVDDPVFDPVFGFLEREGVPLLAHIGEPLACWQPLDPGNPHYHYYKSHPEWHFHERTDVPSHAELIAARDRLLERRPGLRLIGAHLGSLEYDVAEVARRLEAFPNFAVDTSARMKDLAVQDPEAVASFLRRYRDRVLWGTDIVSRESLAGLQEPERESRLAEIRARYDSELAYYRSLGLDEPTLQRLTRRNALEWYPRLGEIWG